MLIDELNAKLAQRPNDTELVTRRAFIHLEHDDWKAALVDLERAARMGANESDLGYLRARALAAGGMHMAAREELNHYISLHTDPGLALVERARVLTKLGEHEASLADYRAALKITPKLEPDLVVETAEALTARGLRDEAIRVLTTGIEKVGNVPQLVLKTLELEIAVGRYDDALTRVEVIAKLMPREEPWMARRASILAQAGRMEESAAAWTALRDHILALPNLERGSHAMNRLLEQTQQALGALRAAATQTSALTPIPSSVSLKP